MTMSPAASSTTSEGYNDNIDNIRDIEFPMLKDAVYLDHAAAAIPSKSLMQSFATNTITHLRGNPHSNSVVAQETSRTIESIRSKLLHMFKAHAEHFDLVFVANATAGIKLVAEAMREYKNGFEFGYHFSSHTSVVGVRELALTQHCLKTAAEVHDWLRCPNRIAKRDPSSPASLFAYPAQSNMNGTRYAFEWCKAIRTFQSQSQNTHVLLDAASYASTSPLDLSHASSAPHFTVVSLYKIFGFPELGAIIIHKSAAHVFYRKKYFGGGTVDMINCDEKYHIRKQESLHDVLEDGSLPIHNILAIEPALESFHSLFGSMEQVSQHCMFLAQRLFHKIQVLRHRNGRRVCSFYHDTDDPDFSRTAVQGPIIAFNIQDMYGNWIGTTGIERLASMRNIQLRTGGLCNPGGVATALNISAKDLLSNYANGHRCGNENDLSNGKPTGIVRVSIGPTNTIRDIDKFCAFVQEFFGGLDDLEPNSGATIKDQNSHVDNSPFRIEDLMIYPIKSCSGWKIPADQSWRLSSTGLAWDREWCVVLTGSGVVMSQKRYPRLTLIRPSIDLQKDLLWLEFVDGTASRRRIQIPLSLQPSSYLYLSTAKQGKIKVCGESMTASIYDVGYITDFFTEAVGIDCQLARFACDGSISRYAKSHLKELRQGQAWERSSSMTSRRHAIKMANESPILMISRSSLNRVNEVIRLSGGKAVSVHVFRANIILQETTADCQTTSQQAFIEDTWQSIRIGSEDFEMLGACRRCHMVNIDPVTAARNTEPYTTLAKIRQIEGNVYFGQHCCHIPTPTPSSSLALDDSDWAPASTRSISTGDAVYPTSV